MPKPTGNPLQEKVKRAGFLEDLDKITQQHALREFRGLFELRLSALKARWEPDNVCRLNHNILGAASPP